MKCKTGQHEWLLEKDAEKCCNGYKRVLSIGNISKSESFGSVPLPGNILYGYHWEKLMSSP